MVIAQTIIASIIAWAVTGLLMLFFWAVRDVEPGMSLGYATLVMGILVIVFGIFSLAGGGIAAETLGLSWAGFPVFTRGRGQAPGGGLTLLGLCLVVAVELFVAAFLLLS